MESVAALVVAAFLVAGVAAGIAQTEFGEAVGLSMQQTLGVSGGPKPEFRRTPVITPTPPKPLWSVADLPPLDPPRRAESPLRKAALAAAAATPVKRAVTLPETYDEAFLKWKLDQQQARRGEKAVVSSGGRATYASFGRFKRRRPATWR